MFTKRLLLAAGLAAGLAGLALSHVVARAVLTSLVDHGVGFFRTPKRSRARGVLRAWQDAREEIVLLGALLLGAAAVLGLALIAYTPLADLWFVVLSGLADDIWYSCQLVV